jgi:hypothetical protein
MPSPGRTTATPFERVPRVTTPIWRFQF